MNKAKNILDRLTSLSNAVGFINGSKFDLSQRVSIFVISPADKKILNGIVISLKLAPGALIRFQSLEFKAYVLGDRGSISGKPVNLLVNGKESLELLNIFLLTGVLENKSSKNIRIEVLIFDENILGDIFVVDSPLINVEGRDFQIPFLHYKRFSTAEGYRLVDLSG